MSTTHPACRQPMPRTALSNSRSTRSRSAPPDRWCTCVGPAAFRRPGCTALRNLQGAVLRADLQHPDRKTHGNRHPDRTTGGRQSADHPGEPVHPPFHQQERPDRGDQEQAVGVDRAVQEERVRVHHQHRDRGERSAPRQPRPHPAGEQQHRQTHRPAPRAASRRSAGHRRPHRTHAATSGRPGRTRPTTAGQACRSSRNPRSADTNCHPPDTSRPATPGTATGRGTPGPRGPGEVRDDDRQDGGDAEEHREDSHQQATTGRPAGRNRIQPAHASSRSAAAPTAPPRRPPHRATDRGVTLTHNPDDQRGGRSLHHRRIPRTGRGRCGDPERRC